MGRDQRDSQQPAAGHAVALRRLVGVRYGIGGAMMLADHVAATFPEER
jgi:hypothetical protein